MSIRVAVAVPLVVFVLASWGPRAVAQGTERFKPFDFPKLGGPGAKDDDAKGGGEDGLKDQGPAWKRTLKLATDLMESGDLDDAERMVRIALDEAERDGPGGMPQALVYATRAKCRSSKGRYLEAEADARRAIEITKAALGEDSPLLADCTKILVGLKAEQRLLLEAVALAEQIVAIRRRAAAATPGAGSESNLAEAMYELANLCNEIGRDDEAGALYGQAVELCERTLGKQNRRLPVYLMSQALRLAGRGELEPAREVAARSLRMIEEVYAGPDRGIHFSNIAVAALVAGRRGDRAEAEQLLGRALAIFDGCRDGDVADAASTLKILADLPRDRKAATDPVLPRALALYRTVVANESLKDLSYPQIRELTNNLPRALLDLGRVAEARALLERALPVLTSYLGAGHSNVAIVIENIGVCYLEQYDYPHAEERFREAIAIKEKALGPDHPWVAAGLSALSATLRRRGRLDEAEEAARRSLAIREKAMGPGQADFALSLDDLAEILRLRTLYAEAWALSRRALKIVEKSIGPDEHVPEVLGNQANIARDEGKQREAEELYRRSIKLAEERFGPDHPALIDRLEDYAALLDAAGRAAEAGPLQARATVLRANLAKVEDRK